MKLQVLEKDSYDHVRVESCNCQNYTVRMQDEVSMRREALSAASALGVKRGSLSIKV